MGLLFTAEVLEKLARLRRPEPSKWDNAGKAVRERHLVVAANGPQPSPARWANRRAWAEYIRVASTCGLLDEALRKRLVGVDDDDFRSALSECCAAWYFVRRRRANVRPNPASKSNKNFDLLVSRNGLVVHSEVKAPYVPQLNNFGVGDDLKVLRKSISDAGAQLKKGTPSLVILVPAIRTPVSMNRGQLLKATIGEPALAIYVSRGDSKPPPPKPTFIQDGKLAKVWPAGDGAFRTDLTRVSAVMTIEQRRLDGPGGPRLSPVVIVVHNPFAAHPIDPEFFGKAPQWVVNNGMMQWSDRYGGP